MKAKKSTKKPMDMKLDKKKGKMAVKKPMKKGAC